MAKIDSYDNDVVRNFALEKVLKLLQDKKEAETKAYFDELVNNAIKDNAKDLGDQIVQTSSIQTIFAKHLKNSLLEFQSYQRSLNKQCEDQIDSIKKLNIGQENSDEIAQVQQKFNQAQKMLLERYDEHMSQILPKPQLLPVRVNVILVKKNG